MIDGQIKLAQSRRECFKPFEIFRATFLLPSEIALEKIMQYEAHLSREGNPPFEVTEQFGA
jgi:hypothetical protein